MRVSLLACAAIRLAWSVRRKEKGKTWVFYVVLLLLAAPLTSPLLGMAGWLDSRCPVSTEGCAGAPAFPRVEDALSTPASTPRKRKTTLPRLIEKYYADLGDLAHQNVMYEMGTRPAFHALLAAAGKEAG